MEQEIAEITTAAAKKNIKDELDRLQLPYTRLTARTVGFEDLARAKCVFVKIDGWKPHEAWNDLKQLAVSHGFRIEI